MEYFLFISVFALFTIGSIKSSKERVILYYLFVFAVSILVGLRGNQDEYSQFYYLIPSLENIAITDLREKEPFFIFVVSLFQFLSLPAQSLYLFFSSVAVIINGYFFKSIETQALSKDPVPPVIKIDLLLNIF